MRNSESPSFACPVCGSRFEWTSQRAARPVLCGCGARFTAPGGPDPTEYALAPEPNPAETGQGVPVASLVAAGGSASTPIAYERARGHVRPDRYDVLESSPVRHLYAPLALTLLGAGALFATFVLERSLRLGPAPAARLTGYIVAWNLAVMFLGACLVARLIGSGFGHVSTALVRLAAVATAPLGVAALFNLFGEGLIAAGFGWLASIATYWLLFAWLFELDPQEALIAVGVTTVLRWASYLLYWIALHRILPSPF